MPETDYTIRYSAPPSKIEGDIGRIVTKLKDLDVQIDKTRGKLRLLGSDTSGLTKLMSGLKAVDKELSSKVADAGKAATALANVGKDNRAVTALTSRLQALQAQLAAVTAAAGSAGAATAGVGTGGATGRGAGGGGGGGAGRSGIGVARAVAGHAVLMAARKTYGAFGESIGDRRSFLSGAADTAGDFRAGLQELAAFQGKPAADNALIREQLAFQQNTGMNPTEAADFRLAFGSANVPGLSVENISKETAAKLEPMVARFGKRYGIDAGTTGQMAGLISSTRKIGSPEEGLGILAESAELLNIYGRTSVKSMAGPMVGLQAEMLQSEEGGRFKDFESLSGVFGPATFKFRGPAQAATGVRQANRLLRSFGDTSPLGESKEKFLRDAGITPEDDFESGIRKLAASGVGSTDDLKLKAAGFHNTTDIASTLKFIGLLPTIDAARKDPRILGAAAAAPGLEAQYQASQTGRQQGAENTEFAATINVGLEGERLRTARTQARARMIAESRLKAGFFGTLTDSAASMMTSAGGISGEELRIDTEAMAGLIRGGKQVGVDVRKIAPSATYRMDSGQNLDSEAARSDFNRAYQAVEQAGGDPLGGAPKRAAASLRRAADDLDALGNPRGRPAPPGNGGAGYDPARR